ncbi:ABC transporter ATP-binding protein [Proteiniclasticum sp. QWL-01]|uniref:ATP-binding cassette domain-containing protein n=1 Tax=Proteiniclasticum sp. QWL-01 TaxID=3036945 RepID=UPI00240EDEFE|nr:ABC transporter ATP-binding protein [Proteiniclasticum sp. QWL-01]WFF72184.1 ABC transporter ATP-binding protein [Proteiniclasticum sp. QWL-01]
MSHIELKNVSKRFKNKLIYSDLNFSVEEGECVGIVGSNGSGKSILFKLISGLEDADQGTVIVSGKEVGHDHDFPKNIGLFVNEPAYIEYYDGFTNLKMLAQIQNKISDVQIREAMQAIGLDPDDKTMVKNYSSGMKQKLGIVQAVMENQQIILLDEPFNALDYETNLVVAKLIRSEKDKKRTIILTSHQHQYLQQFCDRILMIQNNSLVPFDEERQEAYFKI